MNWFRGWLCQVAEALYLDAGYILDSIWRRAEFNLHKYFRYVISPGQDTRVDVRLTARPEISLPRFWFFAAVIVFVAYGPTLDALCGVLGSRGMQIARFTLGALLVVTAGCLLVVLTIYGTRRADKRFLKAKVAPQARFRRGTVRLIVELGMITLLMPMTLLGVSLWTQAAAPICHRVPESSPAVLQMLVTIVALACAAFGARRAAAPAHPRGPLTSFILLGILVSLLWLWIAAPSPSEATQTPYPHVYAVFALAVAAVAAVAPYWAQFMFRSTIAAQRDLFRGGLSRTELFPSARIDPDLSVSRIVASTATGIVYNLLQLLLLPSFFLLIVPSEWIPITVVITLLASVVLVTLGNLATRWQQMLVYIKRWFFVGTPLITSLVVIGLAALRLGKVQYVTTVLDAAPFGVIFIWIVMNYVLFWWFEHVVNEAAARELLRLLGTDAEAARGLVSYRPDRDAPLTMPPTHRWIAPHGMGRLIALGWAPDKDSREPLAVFQAFDFVDLFTRITPAGREETRNDLRRQLQLYFFALNCALLLGLAAFLGYYGHGDRTNTVQSVIQAGQPAPDTVPADLPTLLSRQAAHKRPAIVLATSGGGTRAALFTASALQGLAKLGLSQDIVLLSGVSGGGVAAAYFYAHQKDLQRPYATSWREWRDFEYHMTDPFIGDVLEGATEWRVVSRMALGVLLKESFERQLFTSGGLQHLGDAASPALILNTTVTGNPQEDSDLLRGRFLRPKGAQTCDQLHLPYANVSGGRLIFTNLRDRSAFPDAGGEVHTKPEESWALADVRLPYVVVQDPQVPLSAAAALNANFPPIFTNARVNVPAEVHDDECPDRAYYVTDGGATESLGFVSALYALRKALRDMQANPSTDIPEIHLVLIEASATTYDYTPDRGINAATGGSKERLTGGLTVELVNQINKEFKLAHPDSPTIQTHYLVMPLAFRSRGGFGTHWMFPQSIAIENPRTPRPVSGFGAYKRKVLLHRCELLALWEQLHDPRGNFCGGPFVPTREGAMQTVADWVCGKTPSEPLPPDLHVEQWNQLVQELGDAGSPSNTASAAQAAAPDRLEDCKDQDRRWPDPANQ
jgi:hypothetical protein